MPSHTWVKTGNFHQTFDSGESLNRQEAYRNTSPTAVVSMLELFGYRDGGYEVAIAIKPRNSTHYAQLEEATRAKGFPAQSISDRYIDYLRFRADEKEQIALFIQTIFVEEPLPDSIKLQVEQSLEVDLSQEYEYQNPSTSQDEILSIPSSTQFLDHYYESPRQLLLHNFNMLVGGLDSFQRMLNDAIEENAAASIEATTTEIPGYGENSEKLGEIGFEGDIPEKYLCSLGMEIMTNPVYDPKCPNYKFEEAWILKHLSSNPTNPFTRQTLSPEDLVADQDLKSEIDSFVEKVLVSNDRKDDNKKCTP